MEEERKAISELGLIIRNVMEDYPGQLPRVVRDRVKEYVAMGK